MSTVLLLTIGCLILVWQLVNALCTHKEKSQEFQLIQDKNHELINLYKALGQSIMALNIQLQVAQKLWQIQPTQAQQSVTDAYQLSGELMQELRQIVRNSDTLNTVVWIDHSQLQPTQKCWISFLEPTSEKSGLPSIIRFLISEKQK